MPEWGTLMETGIPLVDAQHRELVERINELGLSMRRGRGGEVLIDLMVYLRRYANQHFETEERIMVESGYPSTEEHRVLHRAFREDLACHFEVFASSPAERSTTLNIHKWLMKWLQNHVLYVDLKLADHMRDRGLI